MKKILILSAALLTASVLDSGASAFSQQVAVDRYTILDDGSIEYDVGNLLDDGQFRVIGSDVYDDDPAAYAPIDGRPVLWTAEYATDKAGGFIPNWVCSADAFYVGITPYVIVAIRGKGDPNPTITISTQPQGMDAPPGGFAFFYVEADPIGYLSYQWEFKGKGGLRPIPGATGPSLEIDGVTATNAGEYVVEISSGGKPIASEPAALNVIQPVTISKEPLPVTVKAGASARFSVLAKGTRPTYQWYFNGSAINGATNNSYTVRGVGTGNVGPYYVLVSGEFSYQWSVIAPLALGP